MRGFHDFVCRRLWWTVPLLAAISMFNTWVSWATGEPTTLADIAAAFVICVWVWLMSFDRRP